MEPISFRKIAIIFLIGLFGFINFLNFQVQAADDANDIQNDINKLEKKAEQVQQDLNASQSQLNQVQSQVYSTQNIIKKTEEDISRKEGELDNLNNRLELNRNILRTYIREIYYLSQEDPLIRLALGKQNLGELVVNFDSLVNVKEKVLATIEEIDKTKEEIEGVKNKLATKKEEHEKILVDKKEEQGQIYGDVQEKKLTLAEIQKKMSRLRSMLSAFLGKSFTLDDVVREVKYASGKTGVRKEFIFAMLDKETDLGRFTGGCYYSKGKNPVKKHMKSADQSAFLDLMDELGYGDNDQKLSCWPGYGYGGAMGIAQFMPSTWLGYKTAIKNYTGHNPPNPWNITDGIIGMAEKLKRAGAASKSKEHYAAKVYYCGGSSSPYWNTRCEAYADTVISWSKGYDDYF
jgi:peptidoglycan hydrolase CwlO-like protein